MALLNPLYAVPAAVAGLAYLNARTCFPSDRRVLSGYFRAHLGAWKAEKNDQTNLFYVLEGWAKSKSHADSLFLIYQGREWTYKQTYDMVLKYATWLVKYHNIKKGETVAMDFMNSDNFIFLWFGLFAIGAVPSLINYNLRGDALIHCLRASSIRLAVVDEAVKHEFDSKVMSELASSSKTHEPVEVVFFTGDIQKEVESCIGQRPEDSTRSGAVGKTMAFLVFTSGTTGLPKAAVVGWSKLRFGSKFGALFLDLKQKDRFYTCMPMYHGSATLLGIGLVLHAGCTLVIGRKFSTRGFWEEVRSSKATVVHYVGETCRYLLAASPQIDPQTGENLDLNNDVRIAFGNGLRPDVWNKFKERFGIETVVEFYAASEGVSGSWNHSNNDFTAGAVGHNGWIGQALQNSRTEIVEVDWETEQPRRDVETGRCIRVSPGEPGEVLYKLDAKDVSALFQGYHKNEKATNSKILLDVFTKGDAWFRTGDVLRLDKEGRWYFSDRIGDTYRWRSENVSTAEVSEAMGRHEHVYEANVYGIKVPNHDGRAGCATIELALDPDVKLLDSLAKHAQKCLPSYAIPLFLRIAKTQHRTGTNKQQKTVLRNEGVDPSKTGDDQIFWLRNGIYIPFSPKDWQALSAARVHL